MSYTTRVKIEVSNEVHSTLRMLKERGDSFNDVLERILSIGAVEDTEGTEEVLEVGQIELFAND